MLDRKELRRKMSKVVKCKGKIRVCTRKGKHVFGYNASDIHNVLVKPIKIDELKFDHMWIKSNELLFPPGTVVSFKAEIRPYQKGIDHYSYTLSNIREVKVA